jgi:hypothetical protein
MQDNSDIRSLTGYLSNRDTAGALTSSDFAVFKLNYDTRGYFNAMLFLDNFRLLRTVRDAITNQFIDKVG